jgi:hypothetical protein
MSLKTYAWSGRLAGVQAIQNRQQFRTDGDLLQFPQSSLLKATIKASDTT